MMVSNLVIDLTLKPSLYQLGTL